MIIIPDFLPLQEKSGHEGFDESRIVGVIPNGQEQKIQRGCKKPGIERLRHQWSGCSSVRLSNSYIHRLIFRETSDGLQVELIDIDDTHYGNKH